MHLLLASLPGPTDNTPALRALEYGVIILLWLFFMWVVRAVWVEVRPLRRRRRRRGAELDPVVDGKSRRARQMKLHVIRPEEEAGRVYDIGDEVTVGRAPGCGVPIDYDSYSSNLHARLFRLDGDLWAEDLNSTNGTWVNTIRIDERTKLQKGDLLQIGGTVFEVGK
jgi:pSer/pThr/pTyr-binding forkhead associated (FHA) protein